MAHQDIDPAIQAARQEKGQRRLRSRSWHAVHMRGTHRRFSEVSGGRRGGWDDLMCFHLAALALDIVL